MQVNRTNSTSFRATLIPRNLTNAQHAVVAELRKLPGDRTCDACDNLLRFVDQRIEDMARVKLGNHDIPHVAIDEELLAKPGILEFVEGLDIAYFPHKLNIGG